MKAKVLLSYYSDRSDFTAVRVYQEKHFEQAIKDFELVCEYASDSRTWKLEDIEMYGEHPDNHSAEGKAESNLVVKESLLLLTLNEIENAMERWHHARDNNDETLEKINAVLFKIGRLGWFNKAEPTKS